ncbi:MAG: hypothetical protein OEN49_07990 [Gammaproteobacteria bacterium]|nr:hypothetical protein [Gammaproteobacteria bacterium]MDH3563319.1 hypothetical protein [Gammaproteobacteria bacterium]MDH5486294.1 hypothetical protein [Gammaproteobacteria bacterium]
MLKYIFAWVPMLFIAIANGVLRQVWYAKYLSELKAHQLSTLIGALLIGIYIWVIVRSWIPASARQAVAIGMVWLGLTVTFEFLFGHFVAGHSWLRLRQDYNLLAGRVWILLLFWVAVAPYIFYRINLNFKPINKL